MKRKLRFLFILIPITFLALAATATMGLWNWLMPSLFGLTAITFVKALGLFVFIRLLLGGWGWRRPHYRFAFAGHPRYMDRAEWQQRMQEKWQNMTPDQRAKFSGRCGWSGSDETTESK